MRYLVLVCLLLASCTVGITTKKPAATVTATATHAPTRVARPTSTPTRTAPPTPTPTPRAASQRQTAVPTPSPTADEAGPVPAIQYLRSNTARAAPNDTIVLEWASTGATQATLYYVPLADPVNYFYEQVDTTASKAYEIPPWEGNNVEFRLEVRDEAGRTAQAIFLLELLCPGAWFFAPAPGECGVPPIVSQAAEQRFEHGAMIWIAETWSQRVEEKGWIFVLYDDGQSPAWQILKDQWREGLEDHDPALTPPPGREQPIRGFGLAWRQEPQVRQRLGWALEGEKGFSTTIQRTARLKDESLYLRAHDGNVWHLEPGGVEWEKIAAQN
jgi:hypothetical protein